MEQLKQASTDGMGYLQLQTTRPQTLAYALTDSPVGQLAWIVEKFKEWTDAQAPLLEQAVDRDQLLANVSLYWLTRSGASAAHALYESMHAQDWSVPGPAPSGGQCSAPMAWYGAWLILSTRSSTGRSSNVAGTSRQWKCRNCWSTISASSSAPYGEPLQLGTSQVTIPAESVRGTRAARHTVTFVNYFARVGARARVSETR